MSYAAHASVMEKEIIAALAPKTGGVYVDATFGGGGYARAILAAADCAVYGFDRDPTAIERAQDWADEYGGRLHLVNRPFAEMEEALKANDIDAVDGVVFDLGVSSMQLDEADRGFSFRRDGPLSMRMDGGEPDAGDVVALADARELAAIFRSYGEEKKAGAIARAIVRAREAEPIRTTKQLALIVEKTSPASARSKIHPATRVFQALRIFVNDELGQLAAGLRAAERLLRPAGRLVAVTFHSLEDRIVKRFFANRAAGQSRGSRHAPPTQRRAASFELLNAKAVTPSDAEVAQNARARSAKLRAGIRLETDCAAVDDEELFAAQPVDLRIFREGKSR